MSFLVENGSGTPNATSYVATAFVTSYLTDRGRETENTWSTRTTAVQEQACVIATSYLDTRWGSRLKGLKLRALISGRAAEGTLTLGANPLAAEAVVVGQKTYTFVSTLAAENDVLIGATAAASATNLVAAINGTDDGTAVQEDTLPNYEALASVDGAVVTVAAHIKGVNGNTTTFTTTVTGATITGSGTLLMGLDAAPQPLEFPRRALTDRYGNPIPGVPLGVRQATAEYAVRSLAATLDPDPTVDDTGALVQRTMDKLGEMETETEYVAGAQIAIHRPYPAADRLMAPFVLSAGVIR